MAATLRVVIRLPQPSLPALALALLASNGHRRGRVQTLTMVVCRPRAPPSPQSPASRELPDRPLARARGVAGSHQA